MKFIKLFYIIILFVTSFAKLSYALTDENIMNDGAIGYDILTTKHNNEKFAIMVSLTDDLVPNCKNYVTISVQYNGFGKPKSNENLILKFDLLSDSNERSVITSKSDNLTLEQINEIEAIAKRWEGLLPVINQRAFLLKKEDYKKLTLSKEVKYTLTTRTETIQGEFTLQELKEIRKYNQKLLPPVCW